MKNCEYKNLVTDQDRKVIEQIFLMFTDQCWKILTKLFPFTPLFVSFICSSGLYISTINLLPETAKMLWHEQELSYYNKIEVILIKSEMWKFIKLQTS